MQKKVAVVTGGFGILGWEFSRWLYEGGWRVFIIDTGGAGRKLPYGMTAIRANVTRKNELQAALKLTGKPDLLINCAAIDSPPGKSGNGLLETEEDEVAYDVVQSVNVKGTILASQVFGRVMRDGGCIINVSSIYGHVSPDQRIYDKGFQKPIAYCVSKAAIPQVTRYFAAMLAPKVRVNCLTFGGVSNGQDKGFVERYNKKVPLGRMACRSEYAAAIEFVLECTYLTGSDLVIDGGYLSW